MTLKAAGLLALLIGTFGSTCQATTPGYAVTLLAPLSGKTSYASAINNAGQIVGSSTYNIYGNLAPTIWTAGVAASLPFIPISSGSAYAINELGQAVGSTGWLNHATSYFGGNANDLGVYGAGDQSAAFGINDSQQIVGYSRGADFVVRATVWEGGKMTALGTVGGIGSFAYAINQSSQVVGFSWTANNGGRHATSWTNGVATDLGTLGGSESFAYGLNDLGQVVGSSKTAGNSLVSAVLWQGGTVTSLDSLGGSETAAGAINAAGLIVGGSWTADNQLHAVLWRGTTVTDLNSFLDANLVSQGWVLSGAADVNDAGFIVGTARNTITNETRGFVLSPVPEPSAGAMFLLGIGLLWTLRKPVRRHFGVRATTP